MYGSTVFVVFPSVIGYSLITSYVSGCSVASVSVSVPFSWFSESTSDPSGPEDSGTEDSATFETETESDSATASSDSPFADFTTSALCFV